MKLFASLLLIAAAISSVFAQSPADLGVGAIGLVVSDIEASEQFYTEVIGMQPAGEFSLDSDWSDQAGMSGGMPFSVKMFKMVNESSATILKLAYFEETDRRESIRNVGEISGVNYLTLNYNDLEDVEKRVTEADIEIIGRVSGKGYSLIIIKDPDGIFIELVGPN